MPDSNFTPKGCVYQAQTSSTVSHILERQTGYFVSGRVDILRRLMRGIDGSTFCVSTPSRQIVFDSQAGTAIRGRAVKPIGPLNVARS